MGEAGKVVAVIQARAGSSRLPGKVLKPILGTPMLARMIERVQKANTLDAIVLATTDKPDDDATAALGASCGVGVFRGSETDVLDRMYRAAKGAGATAVVRLTGDCPLMDPKVIDDVVEKFQSEGCDYTSTPRNYPEGLDTEVFTFLALERAWNEAKLPSEREHVTPYIYTHPELFRCVEWRSGADDNSAMHWSVDTEADFQFVSKVYEALHKDGTVFGKDDVLALVHAHPELLEINKGGTGYEGYAKSLEEDKASKHGN
jgi:spore coat polysaccharide biosynthesis protein SpsF